MNCARCAGLMVPARFIDLEQTGYLWMSGWRCMNCGHVADAVTEYNRKLQAQGLMAVVTGDHKPRALQRWHHQFHRLGCPAHGKESTLRFQ